MHVILQRVGGAPNFCLTFEDETQYALPRAPFDAADELPKGTFTLAFWFRLHSRRAPTAANVIIWYSPVTSTETYLQANARIDRPGQRNPMTIVHIQGSPVENRLYSMLQGNINNHEKLIDLYKKELVET